jgi:hypothetical protein
MFDFPGVFLPVSEDIGFRLQLDFEMFFAGKLSLGYALFMIDIVYDSDFSLHAYIISWKSKKENVFLFFSYACVSSEISHAHARIYEKIPAGA